ncbi:MAG: hypothetical protein LQ349_002056 [Xanthoria aureola]|nr:MAG: hypothetical protein LQ349_002056 [Xanthoria aureola]
MAQPSASSLVSSHRASDSGLQIHLHPLVLLTVSDFITRHTLRRQQGPIVGALLGQHTGRDITLEHAFECQVVAGPQGALLLHQAWFQDRLQQYKDVHKDPALDLVGWFTTTPPTGPEAQHVPIHQQIIHDYNETAVLLAFHPASVLAGGENNGKLPLTVYESVYESHEADGDRSMDLDGQQVPLNLKFHELPCGVETGQAEMISVDFVARGGGNAASVDSSTPSIGKGQASQAPVADKAPREASSQPEAKALNDSSLLSSEDEELIASLTARANAIKMLHTRIQLLRSYLTSLPPSYLPAPPESNGTTSEEAPATGQAEINHPILRSIQALVHRLPLLIPSDGAAFEQESLSEKSDVTLVGLLGDLTRGTKNLREMGRKFGIVSDAKQQGRRGGMRSIGPVYEDTDEVFQTHTLQMGQPYEWTPHRNA